jgi:hypothetical protein
MDGQALESEFNFSGMDRILVAGSIPMEALSCSDLLEPDEDLSRAYGH